MLKAKNIIKKQTENQNREFSLLEMLKMGRFSASCTLIEKKILPLRRNRLANGMNFAVPICKYYHWG